MPKNDQEEMDTRIRLFNKEFIDLQNKYQLRVISNIGFPGGAILTVPLQVAPLLVKEPEKKKDIINPTT